LAYVQPLPAVPAEEVDGIDFRALVRLGWRYRLVIAVSCLVFGLLSLVLALFMEPYFRAETVLVYVHDKGMGAGAGSLDTALGGLASLAGMNMMGADTEDQQAMAVLDSRHLAEEFIQRNQLIPVLLRNSKKRPTMWRAVQQFKDGVLQVHKDPRKGVTTIDVVWRDPQQAAQWANQFAALTNEAVRKHTIDESSRNIAYLNEQIAKTNDVDLRRLLYDILETETKTLMLANARADYAFQIVDPAVAPEIKAGPHRSLVVLGGLVLGFMLAGGYALADDRLKQYRRARAEHTQPTAA
jgi:uncharacterized protein involved in exopolysaccharide biosynthesis